MSERNGGGGPEARGSGSSLTDAVVAALANVQGPSPASGPPSGANASGANASGANASGANASGPNASGANASGANASGASDSGDKKDPGEKKDRAERKDGAPAEPAAKVSPTVITGTPEPAPSAATAAVTPAPTVEVRGEPAASLPSSSETPKTAIAEVATAGEPSSAESPSAVGTGGPPEGSAAAPSETAAPSASEAATSSEAASEPTMRIGGAPIETLTKEAGGAVAEGIAIQYYGRTDVGLVREHNEDNYLVADLSIERRGNDGAILKTTLGTRGLVLAVCDGMGGAAAGEVASQMAVDTIHEILQAGGPPRDHDVFARRLVRAIEEAGARIFSAAKMDRTRRGMGTTSTVAGLVDSTLFVGQVGDSRAYVLRGDQFALITKDQSLVNQLIEAGQLTEEEAEAFEHSNIILQALGTTEEVTVDLTFLELRRGDRLLMCSDGLSGLVHADMMREVLKNARDLSEAAQQLIAMANAGGGHDNITVILAEFDGQGLRETSADARVAYQQYPLPPEDPSLSESAGKSATSIKSGGPKPGADVKGGEASREGAPAEPGGSRLWVFAVIVLLVLMAIAAVIVLMDDGEHADAADDGTTRVTIASEVSARPAPPPSPAPGRIVVRTDVEGAVLYVNGARTDTALGAETTTLSLAPGAYRLELRRGDVRIADTTVTVESGREERVAMTMPAGEIPEPGTAELGSPAAISGPAVVVAGPQPSTLDSPVAQQQVAQQQRPSPSSLAQGSGPRSQGAARGSEQGGAQVQAAPAEQVPATAGQVL